jgi:hypothetical protein
VTTLARCTGYQRRDIRPTRLRRPRRRRSSHRLRRVHRIPRPTFVTIAKRPSARARDRNRDNAASTKSRSEIFYREALDSDFVKLPDGQISPRLGSFRGGKPAIELPNHAVLPLATSSWGARCLTERAALSVKIKPTKDDTMTRTTVAFKMAWSISLSPAAFFVE